MLGLWLIPCIFCLILISNWNDILKFLDSLPNTNNKTEIHHGLCVEDTVLKFMTVVAIMPVMNIAVLILLSFMLISVSFYAVCSSDLVNISKILGLFNIKNYLGQKRDDK